MVRHLSPLRFWLLLGVASISAIASNDGNWTVKHEAGRCAIKGHCGKQSFFGGQLPCPDNSLADEPDKELRKKVIEVCGKKWEDGKMCCNEEQVTTRLAPDPSEAHAACTGRCITIKPQTS